MECRGRKLVVLTLVTLLLTICYGQPSIIEGVSPLDELPGHIRQVTHRYYHEGYTRALYLANDDILLSGARKFDTNGAFGEYMHVASINDGPVTFLLDSAKLF